MELFRDKQDHLVFLSIIRQVQLICKFQIFAWCLMKNHYHLLFKDVSQNLPDAIGLIQEKYAIYFNAKYNHSGSVFMKPFKSKPVYGYNHFFLLLCYILNNPVKAGIKNTYNDYMWNSPLLGYEKYNITDYLYVNFYYKPIAGLTLDEYIKQSSSSRKICDLEIEAFSEEAAKEAFNKIVRELCGLNEFSAQIITKKMLEEIVSEALYQGISARQISKETKISISSIYRMKNKREYI